MNIQKLLKIFRLRDIEAKLYEELFLGGTLSASEIAKRVEVSRTSVYDLLEHLVAVGLITETLQGVTKKFIVQSPAKIQLLIAEKEQELNDAKCVTEELQQTYNRNHISDKPRLQLFEGRAELQQMMKDLLLYRDITVFAYWPIKKMLALLSSEFLINFHKERAKRNIALRVIWPATQLSALKANQFLNTNLGLKREARVAPHDIDFSLGYSIYNNTVRFISSSNENFGFLVESFELAEMMKTQYDILWKNSKRLK